MRVSGRRLGRRPLRWLALRLAAALLVAAGALGTAAAREVAVRGAQMKGFGRIELRFDEPTKVRVRSTNGVVVIAFDAPARVAAERLAAELSPYLSAVRRDPDGTGLRLALVAPVRTSLLEAGERVFLDLLPPNWPGLPPGLPPEVVAELAERARVAEARIRAETHRKEAARRPVALRLAELPTLTRLVFEPPAGTPIRWKSQDGGVEVVLDGELALDLGGARPRGASGIAEFSSVPGAASLTVRLALAEGYSAHGIREGETLVLDLSRPSSPAHPPPPAANPKAAKVENVPPAARGQEVTSPPPAGRPEPAPVPARAEASPSSPPPPDPVASARPAVTIRPVAVVPGSTGGGSVLFPFAGIVPAAAFQQADRVTILFDTADRVDQDALRTSLQGLGRLEDIRAEPGLVLIRLAPAEARAARLAPEGAGWRLHLGDQPGLPSDVVKVSRSVGADGSGEVAIGLAAAGSVRWIEGEGGTRQAVVTASGRAQALTTARHFVEFGLLPSLQGILVEARADDVTVALGRGGVLVSRRDGLSLSPVGSSGEARGGSPLAIARETWMQDGAGSTVDRYRELVAEAAGAPRSARAEARYRLARFLLANNLSVEAASVLALARSEDAVFAGRRETALLSGIASVRADRPKEARGFLAHSALSDDPEAILWRAVIDARERDWTRSLAGFRRSAETLGLYPEDLSGALSLVALRSALEAGDTGAAERIMAAIDRLPAGVIPRDDHDLARARLDEAASRTDAALKAYGHLAEDSVRPVQAEAVLRGTALAARAGRLPAEEAASRLELLSVSWRGDDVELGTLVELARLYAGLGRWREMFAASRRANHSFPNHDVTRALHEDTARRFENLLLGEGSARFSAVETLALYYDFKEFAPIGRRGDEIVRRLADRLVELDLLDQAADLLQHQVDRRLTGAARAAVAARLAAIRLMSGKPALALAALQSTRLAELPATVRRFRLLLEAQAEADQTRTDLALEIVDGETGADFARLRAVILFGARRWREAGDASEGLLGTRWEGPEAFGDRERADVIRAAVAHVLAEETLALDRLRAKFGAKMADSPDAKTFELLLQPGATRTREFRAVLRDTGRTDSLRQLLADWSGAARPDRAPVPEAAGTTPPAGAPVPVPVPAAGAAPASTAPRAG